MTTKVYPEETQQDCELAEQMKREYRGMRLTDLIHARVRYERAQSGELAHTFTPQFIRVTIMAIDECIVLGWDKPQKTIDRFLEIARKQPSRPFV